MLLGKRPRPPIRRTTSMTGITVDLANVDAPETPSSDDITHNHQMIGDPHHALVGPEEACLNYYNNYYDISGFDGNVNGLYDQRFLAAMVSPRNNQRTSSGSNFLETAHFLRTCGLCKRRLAPGKDIYMYRGDTAFCSLECREQQMKNDERKEKSLVMASKKEDRHASPSTATSSSKAAASRKSVTLAVA
ncbi:hypothetical protein GH714_036110 [Hevea brasiliensis]|uniref:FLZ-type domain-containing protein n=1 Tax=Hevea brasiliensis TaxID=3981 RepID=A0A6A6KYI3_HEVBR|nr:hypothetical protein GH714_036110 [Hevea brasiliensis]